MSERKVRVRSRGRRAAVVLAALLIGGSASRARAAGPVDLPASSEPRVPVATCVEAAGFVASQGTGRAFERVLAESRVYSRDLLVALPGLRAVLVPRPNSVRLTLWGNLPQLSSSPVLESAVVLHDGRAFDLDFTLVRGRVVLTNEKKKGPARVWLRNDRGGVEITLDEPGASVALDLYGRWPSGVPFSLKPNPGVGPMWFWQINVLKGQVELKTERGDWSMSAPPGPATFNGDSVSGPDPEGPQRRTQLPAWADPTAEALPEAKRIAAVMKAYRGLITTKDATEAGLELMAAAAKDKDKARASMTRQLVIHALAALDEVDRVVDALDNPRHEDMRKAAVVGLRHWIGAAPGRDEKLYKILVDDYAYTKAEATAVMQLLHSPFAADQPETYEALIAYLKHGKLAVRELAAWHLYRLAPAGRDIPYDAGAPASDLDAAVAAWKKLIPGGELPPAPKENGKLPKPKDKVKLPKPKDKVKLPKPKDKE